MTRTTSAGSKTTEGSATSTRPTARWTQQDPLDQTTGLTQGDRHSYAGDDPINLTDPTGRCGGVFSCILHAGRVVLTGAEIAAYTGANAVAAVGCAAALRSPVGAVSAGAAVTSAVGGAGLLYEEGRHF